MEENLDDILLGGQTFSWKKNDDGSFSSVLGGKVRRITRLEDAYDDPFLYDYFDLGYDYEKAKREIREKDEILKEAVDAVGTLRILRQDHFTATISFILSQNNNIKRIMGLYDRLSHAYGHEVEPGRFSFPTAEELSKATEDDLRSRGTGFRAPFIIDAVNKAEILEEVESLPFDLALQALQRVKGIGPKVASCILIFSYQRREGFPLDVWMKKVMHDYYPDKDPSYFHPHEALSQQYLFSWIRQKA